MPPSSNCENGTEVRCCCVGRGFDSLTSMETEREKFKSVLVEVAGVADDDDEVELGIVGARAL